MYIIGKESFYPKLCICFLVIGVTCVCALWFIINSYQCKESKTSQLLKTYLKIQFFLSMYLTSVTFYWENVNSCLEYNKIHWISHFYWSHIDLTCICELVWSMVHSGVFVCFFVYFLKLIYFITKTGSPKFLQIE